MCPAPHAARSPRRRLRPELGGIQAGPIQRTCRFLSPKEPCPTAPVSSSLQPLPAPRLGPTRGPQCTAVSSASSSPSALAPLLLVSCSCLARAEERERYCEEKPPVSGGFYLAERMRGALEVDSLSHGVTVDCSAKLLPARGLPREPAQRGHLGCPSHSVRPTSPAASAPWSPRPGGEPGWGPFQSSSWRLPSCVLHPAHGEHLHVLGRSALADATVWTLPRAAWPATARLH